MFDKTLEAALKNHNMSTNFEELETQVSTMKDALLADVRGQIGEAGDQQQQRIKETVETQIRLLSEKVELVRESAEAITESPIEIHLNITGGSLEILRLLAKIQKPATLKAICNHLINTGLGASSNITAQRLSILNRQRLIHAKREAHGMTYQITQAGQDIIQK